MLPRHKVPALLRVGFLLLLSTGIVGAQVSSTPLLASTLYPTNTQAIKQSISRADQLVQLIGSEEMAFYGQNGYFIPVNEENLITLMRRISSQPEEAKFVLSQMLKWANSGSSATPSLTIQPTRPTRDNPDAAAPFCYGYCHWNYSTHECQCKK